MHVTYEFNDTAKERTFLDFLDALGIPRHPTNGDFFTVNMSTIKIHSTNPYRMSAIMKEYIHIETGAKV